MNNKTDKMIELIGEIINKTRFEDTERLKAILTRYQSRLEAQVKQNGFGFTRTRTLSYFTNNGMFNEIISGISYYRFITNIAKNLDDIEEIKNNLIKTASLLFNRNNLIASVTCSKNDYEAYRVQFEELISSLPSREVALKNWNFDLQKKNEGFQTASKVQYVFKGYNYKKLGYQWSGKYRVLNQILSTDWLQNRVRVVGGAYGGFSSVDELGNFVFMSYRDPNLKETLGNYDLIPDYVEKLEIDDKSMTRYIIGTIAGMDVPLTTMQKGNTAVANYFNKVRKEDSQKNRDDVLNTTLSDIKKMKNMLTDVLKQNVHCVYGNADKIESQKELFGKVEKLIK
jgi:hypothetical protein